MESLPSETTLVIDRTKKFDGALITIISLSVFSFVLALASGYFFFQTRNLKQSISDFQTKKVILPSPTPTPQPEEMSQTYTGQGFSFAYPQDLYTGKTNLLGNSYTDFYLDQYHAEKTQECINQKAETLENPCGFGWYVFSVGVYLNPKDKNSTVNWVVDPTQDQTLKGQRITDSQGRTWQIVRNLPWANDSRMNITNVYYVLNQSGQDIVVSIATPYYQAARINSDFDKQILSTFKLQ